MSEPEIALRSYRAEDEAAVLDVWWDSWHSIGVGLSHPLPRDAWRARWVNEILPTQVVVVAEQAGEIAGFAALKRAKRELTQLFVDAPHLLLQTRPVEAWSHITRFLARR